MDKKRNKPRTMSRRHMYVIDGLTDVQKQKADAQRIANGDARNAPKAVVLHHHRFEVNCDNYKHDYFYPEEGK